MLAIQSPALASRMGFIIIRGQNRPAQRQIRAASLQAHQTQPPYGLAAPAPAAAPPPRRPSPSASQPRLPNHLCATAVTGRPAPARCSDCQAHITKGAPRTNRTNLLANMAHAIMHLISEHILIIQWLYSWAKASHLLENQSRLRLLLGLLGAESGRGLVQRQPVEGPPQSPQGRQLVHEKLHRCRQLRLCSP